VHMLPCLSLSLLLSYCQGKNENEDDDHNDNNNINNNNINNINNISSLQQQLITTIFFTRKTVLNH
jgi:hypothetical protein